MLECERVEVREDVGKRERVCVSVCVWILRMCMIWSQAGGESSRQGGEWTKAAGCPRWRHQFSVCTTKKSGPKLLRGKTIYDFCKGQALKSQKHFKKYFNENLECVKWYANIDYISTGLPMTVKFINLFKFRSENWRFWISCYRFLCIHKTRNRLKDFITHA